MRTEHDDELKSDPQPWRLAYDALLDSPYLAYGALIPWDWLEQYLGEDDGTMRFNGQYLRMKQEIELLGFILSERGTNGDGPRILTKVEMAAYVRNREYSMARRSIRNAMVLGAVDVSDLPIEDQRRHDFWQRKSALAGQAALQILRERDTLPATPEMKVKSVRQLR